MELAAGLIFFTVIFLLNIYLAGLADNFLKKGEYKLPVLTMNSKFLTVFACYKRKKGRITLVSFVAQIVNFVGLLMGAIGYFIYIRTKPADLTAEQIAEGAQETFGNGALLLIGVILMIVVFLSLFIMDLVIRTRLRKKMYDKLIKEAAEADAKNEADKRAGEKILEDIREAPAPAATAAVSAEEALRAENLSETGDVEITETVVPEPAG